MLIYPVQDLSKISILNDIVKFLRLHSHSEGELKVATWAEHMVENDLVSPASFFFNGEQAAHHGHKTHKTHKTHIWTYFEKFGHKTHVLSCILSNPLKVQNLVQKMINI